LTATAYLETPTDGGRRLPIGGQLVIGRGNGSEDTTDVVSLDVPALSRTHARVEQRPSGWWIVDLGSRNGTFVNGERVGPDGARLDDGDEIVLAGAVPLVFRDPLATPIAPRIGKLTGVWIDPETDAVWVDAQRVEPPLSARQLRLLKLLSDNEGEIVTRITIVDEVWDDAAAEGVSDDAVTALIKRLRARLGEFEQGDPLIEIRRGRGVRLN